MKFHQMCDFNPTLVMETRDVALDHGAESRVENRHGGWIAVRDARKNWVFETPGAREAATFFRSAAKPFQAFPLVARGFHARLSQDELALTCASHEASPWHLARVASILAKAGLDESALRCGPHLPLHAPTAQALKAAGTPPTALHNNCSGKHAGMLFCCVQAGLPAEGYLNPHHPLQQEILAVLRAWGDVSEIPTGVDGCGAPVFYLPLGAMALLFAHLGSDPAFAPLAEAMAAYPQAVGGEGRLDTVLMQVSRGRLLAKVGADGVIGVSHREAGQGLILKMADGSAEMRAFAVTSALRRLGWLDGQALHDERLGPFLCDTRANTRQETVGRLVMRWPEMAEA